MLEPASDLPVDAIDLLNEGDKDTLDLTTPIKDKGEKKEIVDKETDDKDEDKIEDKETDEKTDKKDEKTEEDELEEELKALEEELEDPDEEKLELVSPVPRREILKKYPELFRDFPFLESAYYREQQFTQFFPTIEEAEKAAEASKVLDAYSKDMIEEGNTFNVLKMIKDNNPETFNTVVDNYLEHLAQVDVNAHSHVIGNVVKHLVIDMVREAKESGDEDLKTAARILNKHVFNTTKFTPPTKLSSGEKKSEKTDSVSSREQDFIKKQLDIKTNEINTSVSSVVRASIEKHIDPKNSMSDYVKRNAVRDAVDKVTSLMDKDKRFKTLVDKLYEKAIESNFSRESQDKIKKAYFAKAKSLLAPVVKSARNEALKGMGKRVKDDDIETTDKPNGKDNQPTERRLSSDKSRAKLDQVKDMSSLDALNALMGD